jgi:hypothetical protein
VLTPVRVVGAVLATVLFSGCGLANFWNEPVVRAPSITPAPPSSATPEPDDRTLHPYDGTLTSSKCVTASKEELALFEQIGMAGGAIQYPVGAMVKSNAGWWTAAVATRVSKNDSGYTKKTVEPYAFFVTSYRTYADQPDHEPFAWQLAKPSGDKAAARALACAKKLPVPAEKPEPGSPATYTGKLAPHAKCAAVSAKRLKQLEQVGQVGGAITYPRGQMVRANGKWWTVAVATQVHQNSQGYTSENVDPTELFVTNAPSYKASSKARIVSFPIKARKTDTAARKALSCLGA